MSTLDASVRAHLQASEGALVANDRDAALRHAREASRLAPAHPDVLRQLAASLTAFGPSAEALDAIERALAMRPDDVALLTTRAIVLEANGRAPDAVAAFRRADEIAQHAPTTLYNLGRALSKYATPEESLHVLDQVLERDAHHRGARATRAQLLRQLGRVEETIAECRRILADDPNDIKVWSVLATVGAQFDDAELAQLERIERAAIAPEPKARVGFALGRLYEKRHRYADAFAAYQRGNAVVRAQMPWDAARFSAQVDTIRAAFAPPRPATGTLGEGLLFIVSLPRSGSTLTEQMLAAHPQVDAGAERPDLFDVIAAESTRRQMAVSRWVPLATHEDWQRLGHAYLDRAAKWRTGKPFATDKMPINWLWLGVALAMLPGARAIECRRDRLETAWSCYTHLFAAGAQEFSYDFHSIAAQANDFDRAMATWKMLYPERIRTQRYEDLVADTEPQLRALLAFCGLEFDAACLRFHEVERAVRTASAAQVREPLRKDTARGDKYGALLDPLRKELGLPPWQR